MDDKKLASSTQLKNVSPVATKTISDKGKQSQQLQSESEEDSSTISKLADLVKPAAPTSSANFDFHNTDPVWWVSLNNDQTHDIEVVLATLGALAGTIWPPAAIAIGLQFPISSW